AVPARSPLSGHRPTGAPESRAASEKTGRPREGPRRSGGAVPVRGPPDRDRVREEAAVVPAEAVLHSSAETAPERAPSASPRRAPRGGPSRGRHRRAAPVAKPPRWADATPSPGLWTARPPLSTGGKFPGVLAAARPHPGSGPLVR